MVQAVAIGPPIGIPETGESLKNKIRSQIEYYFSDTNLNGDIFIRRKMDPEGYLAISLIATFHRVQNLTTDLTLIIESLLDSEIVQLSEDHIKARPKVDPLKWPIVEDAAGNPMAASPMPKVASSDRMVVNGGEGSPPIAQSNADKVTTSQEGGRSDGASLKSVKNSSKLSSKTNNGGLKLTNGDTAGLDMDKMTISDLNQQNL